jgi:hypothetical protein
LIINWKLEVEDVACPVEDMMKMEVFTFLRSESEGKELREGEQGIRVQKDGRVEDADSTRLWRPW